MPSGRNFSPPGTFQDALKTLESAAAEMAALHAVHEQQQLLFVAQLAQAEEVLRGGGHHAAFALDALDHNGGCRRRERGAHGGEIIVRNLAETGHLRLKALLDLLLAGRGYAGERPAVEGVNRCNDFKAAIVVTELAGQLEQALIGLDAAIAEEAFARANEADKRLRQAALRLVIIEIGRVDELARLLDQCLGNGRVPVTQRTDSNAAAQIQVTTAGNVVKIAARSVAEHDVKAAIARHHVLLKQGLHGSHVVAHDGRRRWNNVFHALRVK